MAPAPTPLRIIDGRQVKAEVHVVKSREFQLTTEEARAVPDLVAGMSLYLIYYYFLCLCIFFI